MSKKNGLLLEDHRHFAEALRRNDEIGERRFSFLVGTIAVTVIGLGALYSKASGTGVLGMDQNTLLVAQIVIGVLLLHALMTYFRMLQANRATREYQETLSYIRRELVALEEAPADYAVPRPLPRSAPHFDAGLAEATGLFCGILFGGLLALLGVPFGGAAVCALGVFAVSALAAQSR